MKRTNKWKIKDKYFGCSCTGRDVEIRPSGRVGCVSLAVGVVVAVVAEVEGLKAGGGWSILEIDLLASNGLGSSGLLPTASISIWS